MLIAYDLRQNSIFLTGQGLFYVLKNTIIVAYSTFSVLIRRINCIMSCFLFVASC
ncbi:hypothetical protein H1P_310007 [Hyella patelloides LEGE 07179]|uniref:Uncharacterized protein n=1 Tax=Hyella patelloides LEGE 07179 TaxID=945734 RepID=A0A563VUF3_9CYAN|nr:hypothetical protein H1P_310007 [Hyella patelloides LEGE 07179]